ncbi:MAG: hypothetical protein GF346_06250 [Candidatus Eisenbacteria bacterium]|nr:hypothetical protein [Candidatus Latescibacterota bacterium]MBD3302027.1 hypothetical protein [Candidatus Eisenbacteria bacterium]
MKSRNQVEGSSPRARDGHGVRIVLVLSAVVLPIALLPGCPDGDSNGTEPNGPAPPGQVQNLHVVATADGAKYRVLWDPPVEGNPVLAGYRVEIKIESQPDAPVELLADLHEQTHFDHDPECLHYGNYTITPIAVDGTVGEGKRVLTHGPSGNHLGFTDPHSEVPTAWSFQGNGAAIARLAEFADLASIYVTDFAEGVEGPLYFASPHLIPDHPADQAATTPDTGFKQCWIRELGPQPRDYPPLIDGTYRDKAEVVLNHYYAVYTPEEVYVLMKVMSTFNDEVGVRIWQGEFPRSRILCAATDP